VGQNAGLQPFPHAATAANEQRDELVANHKQAEKRNRQRIKRRSRNLRHLSTMRTYMKRVRRALEGGQVQEAKEALPQAITAIGRAASKGVVHRNTAARYISRLNRAMNVATAAAGASNAG
jgi:small subunit ribosomal protein S20